MTSTVINQQHVLWCLSFVVQLANQYHDISRVTASLMCLLSKMKVVVECAWWKEKAIHQCVCVCLFVSIIGVHVSVCANVSQYCADHYLISSLFSSKKMLVTEQWFINNTFKYLWIFLLLYNVVAGRLYYEVWIKCG